MEKSCPLVLLILDGWGHRTQKEGNAIALARPVTYQRFLKQYPFSLLEASGKAVGLPNGQMGNSEVGHLTIGAGRPIYQDLVKIDNALENGTFQETEALKNFISKTKKNKKSIHIIGLISSGGVHSHINHIIASIQNFLEQDIPVKMHAILDGRDTPPCSAQEFVEHLQVFSNNPLFSLSTIMGRFYAMDRDKRWDRIEKAYNAIVFGHGKSYDTAQEILKEFYCKDITDEFIPPLVQQGYQGVSEGDSIFFANFRSDRMRQLVSAFSEKNFKNFVTTKKNLSFLSMRPYDEKFSEKVAYIFPAEIINDTLGSVLSAKGLKQLRLAETEKYAHVTYFFNGGIEESFPLEDRIIIPSPDVPLYNSTPEMSLKPIMSTLLSDLEAQKHDIYIVNFANPDMLGHTGDLEATIKSINFIDSALKELEKVILKQNGILLITADHGNAEIMIDENTQNPHTAHTCEKVPFILVHARKDIKLRKNGSLADITPTILDLLAIQKPLTMKGHSLVI